MQLYPQGGDPVPTFNWVFENPPITASILTQSSRTKEHKARIGYF